MKQRSFKLISLFLARSGPILQCKAGPTPKMLMQKNDHGSIKDLKNDQDIHIFQCSEFLAKFLWFLTNLAGLSVKSSASTVTSVPAKLSLDACSCIKCCFTFKTLTGKDVLDCDLYFDKGRTCKHRPLIFVL